MEIIGCSSDIKKIKQLIQQVANTQANVLIIGESGTGKELIARNIHALSQRAAAPFIAVNCAAIPADLLESELFGHEKGAFTGAVVARLGRCELADKGTMFFDEIGEMPLAMQAKLLRVLQDKHFERIGSSVTIKTDMRVVAATNSDLEQAVSSNKFREDLYYRLNVFPIVIPPLRKRIADIPLLLDHFLQEFNQKMQINCQLSAAAKKQLCCYHWPGNVREISNIVERLCILYPNQQITVAELPIIINENQLTTEQSRMHNLTETIIVNKHKITELAENIDLKQQVIDMEKALIIEALQKADGVVIRAAEILGLRRTTLIEKMKKYAINKN